ncbi:MAG: circularly permuted type 2 ATP-grasp protein [Micropruina sp.]
MTGALQDASPSVTEPPRVVLLSPGPGSETAFEQAYLATLLGFPLVEADDLVMHHGTVWLRTGSRLEQVDVVLRRVDAWFADPLELRGDSQLGIPGLIEATRQGRIAVVNPIGAGVLENPGLLPFLDDACRRLLGEDLLLTAPQTWWCGEPAARDHVLGRLERLVIKPISRAHGPVRYGWLLSADERAELTRRIGAEPWLWCGQEPLPLSTAPVVTGAGLEPRRFCAAQLRRGPGRRLCVPARRPRPGGRPPRPVHRLELLRRPRQDVWVISAGTEPAAGHPPASAG